MSSQPAIRQALLRVRDALERRPAAAVQADAPAIALWQGGLATRMDNALSPGCTADLPASLGGGASGPTPGWYFRAGVASCLASCIAMEAALRGITLTHLAVEAHSTSDVRGLLGVAEVRPGPLDMRLRVAIEAEGSSRDQLQALVAAAEAQSPMSDSLRRAIDVQLELAPAGATAQA